MSEKPIIFSGPMVRAILAGTKTQTRRVDPKAVFDADLARYQPGDRLWVRETWKRDAWCGRIIAVDGTIKDLGLVSIHYAADASEQCRRYTATPPEPSDHWRPSIFMPRWASRITLEVTDVRAQRLQEISAEDAKAEGMESCTPYDQFRALWDSINGKRTGCAWGDNPWVWAYTFRRLT